MCAMVCLCDDLIYSNVLELFLVVFLCGSFGFGIPRFAHKPYGRHLSPSARVLQIRYVEGPRCSSTRHPDTYKCLGTSVGVVIHHRSQIIQSGKSELILLFSTSQIKSGRNITICERSH